MRILVPLFATFPTNSATPGRFQNGRAWSVAFGRALRRQRGLWVVSCTGTSTLRAVKKRSRSVLGSTQWGADPGHVRQTCLAVIGRGQSVGVMAPQNQGAGTRTVNIQFRLHAASFQSRCLFQPNPRWLEEVAPLRLTVDHIYQYHRHQSVSPATRTAVSSTICTTSTQKKAMTQDCV